MSRRPRPQCRWPGPAQAWAWWRAWWRALCAMLVLLPGAGVLPARAAVVPLLSAISPEPGFVLQQTPASWWWINSLGEAQLFDAAGRVLQRRRVDNAGAPVALRYLPLAGQGLLALHERHATVYDQQLRETRRLAWPEGARLQATALKAVVVGSGRLVLPLDLGYLLVNLAAAPGEPAVQQVLADTGVQALTKLLYVQDGQIIQVDLDESLVLSATVLSTTGEVAGRYKLHLREMQACAAGLLPTAQGLGLVCSRPGGTDWVMAVMGRRGQMVPLDRALDTAASAWAAALPPPAAAPPGRALQGAGVVKGTAALPAAASLLAPWMLADRGALLMPLPAGDALATVQPAAAPGAAPAPAARPTVVWHAQPGAGAVSALYATAQAHFVRQPRGDVAIVQDGRLSGVLKALAAVPVFVASASDHFRLTFLGSPELRVGATVDWLPGLEVTASIGAPRPVALDIAARPAAGGFSEQLDQMALAIGSMRGLMGHLHDPASFMQAIQATVQRLAGLNAGSQGGTQFGAGGIQLVSSSAVRDGGRRASGNSPFSSAGTPLMEAQIGPQRFLLADYQNPVFSALLLARPATVPNLARRDGPGGTHVYVLAEDTGTIGWRQPGDGPTARAAGSFPATYSALFPLGDQVFGVTVQDEVHRLDGANVVPVGRAEGLRSLKLQGRTAVFVGRATQVLAADAPGLRPVQWPLAAGATLLDLSIAESGQRVWLEPDELVNAQGRRRRVPGAQQVYQAGADGQRVLVLHADGHASLFNRALDELAAIYKMNDGLLVMTPEGYFSGDGQFLDWLNVTQGPTDGRTGTAVKVYPVRQFFDVFHRPDIVSAKLRGDEAYVRRASQELTIERALQNPPPSVVPISRPESAAGSAVVRLTYTIKSEGGGIGEVLVLHNGKLLKSDGVYKDAPGSVMVPMNTNRQASAGAVALAQRKLLGQGESTAAVPSKRDSLVVRQARPKALNAAGEFSDWVDIELIPGEDNEVTVMARNQDNTVLGAGQSLRLRSGLPRVAPQLWILPVGIASFQDRGVPALASPRKDALDFACHLGGQQAARAAGLDCRQPGHAAAVFPPGHIHVLAPLTNAQATRANILARLDEVAARARPGDTFVWFVSSHGMMDANSVYGVVPFDARCLSADCGAADGLVSSNDILDKSKAIKAMRQLLVLDTCQAGALDHKMSGLYDARMTGLARNMGLHLYAAATATESALDGLDANENSLFTATLLQGLAGRALDSNQDGRISMVELGAYARRRTPEASRKAYGDLAPQVPVIQHFGQDAPLAASVAR